MEEVENQKDLLFQQCQQCKGYGFLVQGSGDKTTDQVCPNCQGKGTVAFLAGDFLYWGRRIDNWSILQTRLQKSAKLIINAILVIFGIAGLIFGILELWKYIQEYAISLDNFWQNFVKQTSGGKQIFWWSLLTDLYAYFRMDQETKIKKEVKKPTPAALKAIAPEVALEDIAKKFKLTDASQFFSEPAIDILQDTWLLAQDRKNREINPLHLLTQLINDNNMKVIFARLGIAPATFLSKVKNAMSRLPVIKGKPYFSETFHRLFLYAYYEAFLSSRKKVDVPQLFVAAFRVPGVAKEIFLDLEVDYQKARNVVEWINVQQNLRESWQKWKSKAIFKPKKHMNRALTARPTPLLDSLGRDLTIAARSGALFPMINRESERQEMLRIMQRGKGNVLLVGDPGVGKATLVEGLAQLMASEDVPSALQDKRLVELSTAALVASSSKQGAVEGRMFNVVDEIIAAGNVVLYVDDLSNLVGAGGGGMEESVDVADVLISAIQKGMVKVIGAVGRAEYAQYLQNNDIIMRNFSKIEVNEPDTNTAIVILEARAGSIEYEHQVFFTYDAIDKAVRLSQRYVHDQYLPAKSIKVLEEAAIAAVQAKGKNAMVSGEDVAQVISEKTKVKVTRITESESAKLMNLEDRIHERIINQEEAVNFVASSLRRARAELRDEKRPIVNLLFLGPTGVGKTELAKTVSEIYFGGEDKMVRVDMSEFQNQDSINRLIGSSPGFSATAAGGYLTEAVRRSPFSLVLLDEFEKAHPDILNLFLQVMDDGRLTDGAGRTIDFTNSILIATSNAGTQQIQDSLRQGQSMEIIREHLMSEVLKPYFRPELLNRFDSIVVFKPLAMDHVIQIAYLLLNQVKKRLAKKGIKLEVTEEAVQELAEAGYDPTMGARPLRRVIQERVDNALANHLLTGRLSRRDVAILEKGGKIRVEKAQSF
ncbi:MAG: AAA family ATPase [Patescibacteria group bacterium]